MRKLFAVFVLFVSIVWATNYYVDYDAGSDAANGTTTGTPWKHCPGDSNATGNAASTTPISGDTIKLKGGVYYYGKILIKSSGTEGNDIVYTGNQWGTGRAIIDASTEITSEWTRCTAATQCDTNPNFDSIWYTDLSGITDASRAHICEEDSMLFMAQWPVLTDKFWYNSPTTMRHPDTVSFKWLKDDTLAVCGGASLAGKRFFAYLGNNTVRPFYKVTAFYPPDSLTFDSLVETPYYGTSSRYAIGNSPRHIVKGTYAIIEGTGTTRCFIWPLSSDPNNVRMSYTAVNNSYCIQINAKHDISLIGFQCQKATGYRNAVGLGFYLVGSKRITIDRCKSIRNKNSDYGGYSGYWVSQCTTITISNSVSKLNFSHRGIQVDQSRGITLSNDTVLKVGGTAVTFQYTTLSKILDCYFSDISGGHANGTALYLSSDSILYAWNKVETNSNVLALQSSSNIWVYSNILDALGSTNAMFPIRNGMSGTMAILNNTMLNSANNNCVVFTDTTTTTDIILNNIIDGGNFKGANINSNNAWAGLIWSQSTAYGWTPAANDLINYYSGNYHEKPIDSLVKNFATGDYSIDSTKLTFHTGTDISSYLPAAFGVSYSRDIVDSVRNLAAPSMGAYEASGGGVAATICTLTVIAGSNGTVNTAQIIDTLGDIMRDTATASWACQFDHWTSRHGYTTFTSSTNRFGQYLLSESDTVDAHFRKVFAFFQIGN
jgi:hypothetical protein